MYLPAHRSVCTLTMVTSQTAGSWLDILQYRKHSSATSSPGPTARENGIIDSVFLKKLTTKRNKTKKAFGFKRKKMLHSPPLCRTLDQQIYHHCAHSPAYGFWYHFRILLCHWADRYSNLQGEVSSAKTTFCFMYQWHENEIHEILLKVCLFCLFLW